MHTFDVCCCSEHTTCSYIQHILGMLMHTREVYASNQSSSNMWNEYLSELYASSDSLSSITLLQTMMDGH